MSLDRKGLLSGLREYGKMENYGPGRGSPDLGVIIFNAENNIYFEHAKEEEGWGEERLVWAVENWNFRGAWSDLLL